MWLFNFIAARFSGALAWKAITVFVPIAIAVIVGAGSFALAWKLGRAPLQVEIAEMKTKRADDAKAMADAQALRMSQAAAKSDILALALGEAIVKNQALTSEISHALKTATDGRACLRGRALSLLSSAPGIRIAAPVPQAQPAAATGARAAAADPQRGSTNSADASDAADATDQQATEAVITDTALAIWAARAGEFYEQCRNRLNALIQWHTPSQTTK